VIIIRNISSAQEEPSARSSTLIASLAYKIKPRYHFAGLEGLNYERAPYRNHEVLAESAQHCSRFISLGKVANPKKTKYIYAFNVTPMKVLSREELVVEPSTVTPNPYAGSTTLQQARQHDPSHNHSSGKSAPSNQFFYDTSYTGDRNNYRGRGGRGGKRSYPNDGGRGGSHPAKRQQNVPPTACWFCLASPEVEKHLVVSIGDSVRYLKFLIVIHNRNNVVN